METVFKQVHFIMFRIWDQYGDVRSRDLFLLRNGLYESVAILLFYLVLVTKIGPTLMKNREPFSLKWTLLVYNTIMVLLNTYFFGNTIVNYNYGLDMFDFDYPRRDDFGPIAMKRVCMCHIYLLSKYLDLLDTVFFVFRKKHNQMTKLHLYHHISVPLLGWIVVRMVPTNGPLVIFAILNTFIHAVMHSYYAVAALGPTMRPYLWWKKYVTLLQLYQFVIYTLFSLLFAFKQSGYPFSMQIIAYSQPIIFLVLFSKFYINSYTNKNTNCK